MRLALSTLLALALTSIAEGQEPKPVADSGPRTPAEERSGFHLPDGFSIELVASEPAINKPMNIAFDDRGRLWVTSTVEYPYAVPEGKPARDRVVILSDFADDGHAQSVSTFADGLNIPIGVLPLARGDSALVHSIPNILRLTDTNGDGKADQSEVAYAKYGFRDTHGMTNAFSWGFDGWIYACHGFSNDSTIAGSDKSPITLQSGNAYRMKPDGSRVEVYSRGQVNPFGLAFDPMGNLYSCDCHSRPIYQLLRGGYYPSFGKPDDGLGFAPEMIGHDHGSTGIGGIAYYASDEFPASYQGSIFIGNVVTSRINLDKLAWHGSSPKAIAQPDFVVSDDPWFRPVDIELGPDGALYVADFYNRIIGHYEVPLDHPGRDRERGRIWRISYKGKDGKAAKDPRDGSKPPTLAELIEDLGHPNLAVRTRATNGLVGMGKDAVEAVKLAVSGAGPAVRKAHGLWALHRLDVLDDPSILRALASGDAVVRVHAARILADRPTLDTAGRLMAQTGLGDPSAQVRRASAEALGLHPSPENLRPLLDLVKGVDPLDTHLKHAVRIALRNQLNLPEAWDKLASDPADDKAVADVALGVPSAESAKFLLGYLPRSKDSDAVKVKFVHHVARYGGKGSEDGLFRYFNSESEAGLRTQFDRLKAVLQGLQERGFQPDAKMQELATFLAHRLLSSPNAGDNEAGLELVGSLKLENARPLLNTAIANRTTAMSVRLKGMTVLSTIDGVKYVPTLAALLKDAAEPFEVREGVANLLVGIGQPEARTALVEALATAPARLQTTIATGLALNRPGAEALLDAVAAGKASARPLQERGVAVRLEASGVPDLKARLDSLLKDLPPADQRVLELIEKRKARFVAGGGDPSKGAAVFTKVCAACHQIEGKGARVGPQLDGVGLRGLDRLLEDTLDPNRNVDQAFRTTTLSLADGRITSGLLLRQDGAVLVLADAKGEEVRVLASNVEDRKVSQLSPMPANLADQIDEADFAHLLAYLLAQKPAK